MNLTKPKNYMNTSYCMAEEVPDDLQSYNLSLMEITSMLRRTLEAIGYKWHVLNTAKNGNIATVTTMSYLSYIRKRCLALANKITTEKYLLMLPESMNEC